MGVIVKFILLTKNWGAELKGNRKNWNLREATTDMEKSEGEYKYLTRLRLGVLISPYGSTVDSGKQEISLIPGSI